jgi:5-methylcytosine-specific restriction protein A
MTRRNFSRKTLAEGFLRAGGKCQLCQAKLKTGEGIGDHILPDALGGDPTLENLQIICSVCHKAKTRNDVRQIRKANRQRDKYTGAAKSKNPMPGSRASRWKRKMSGEVVER